MARQYKVLVIVYGALLALLGATMIVGELGLGRLGVTISLGMVLKAALIFWFFMQLREQGGLARLFAVAAVLCCLASAAACERRTRTGLEGHDGSVPRRIRRPDAEVHGQVKRRIVIAITGATGSIYGVRLLEELKREPDVETHLIVSRAGALNIVAELDATKRDVEALADVVHGDRDIGASVASGSFRTDGMIIAPCSMKTLGALATGVADTLVARAADVAFKERRRVVLMVRETPLHLVHLRNMVTVTEMGGIVFPPLPAFYARLDSIDAMVDQTVGRVLDLFGIDSPLVRRWSGLKERNDDRERNGGQVRKDGQDRCGEDA